MRLHIEQLLHSYSQIFYNLAVAYVYCTGVCSLLLFRRSNCSVNALLVATLLSWQCVILGWRNSQRVYAVVFLIICTALRFMAM